MQLSLDQITGWKILAEKERPLRLAYLFFGVIAIVALIAGVRALPSSRYLEALCYLSAAVAASALLTMTSANLALRRRMTPLIEREHTNRFVIRPGSAYRYSSSCFYACTALAATTATVGFATDAIAIDTSTRYGSVPVILAPVLTVLAASMVVCSALGFRRFPLVEGNGRTLTIRGYWAQQEARWDDIESVDALAHRNQAAICLQLGDSTQSHADRFLPGPLSTLSSGPVIIPVDILPTGPVPLLLLLRYYLEHPEARDELDDGRAYDRLRTIAG